MCLCCQLPFLLHILSVSGLCPEFMPILYTMQLRSHFNTAPTEAHHLRTSGAGKYAVAVAL